MRRAGLATPRRSTGAWLPLVLLALTTAAAAQPAEPPEEEEEPAVEQPPSQGATQTPGIEEFIVTSSGQAQALQDTAVSVSSFDQEYLEALGAQTIIDVAQFTPNLEIRSPYSNTNPTLFIRGVGLRDFNANSSSSVAVFNDDVYMNSPVGQLSQLFDVEDVNVLRGPQGAKLGRNASAGAIRILSRRPTGSFTGYSRSTYGRFNQRETEGALELPLWGEVLSMRSAGVWNRRDGFTDNRCGMQRFSTEGPNLNDFQSRIHRLCFNGQSFSIGTVDPLSQGGLGWGGGFNPGGFGTPTLGLNSGIPGFVREKVNDTNNWAARSILRFQPTRNHDWSLKVSYSQNRATARQLQHLAVGDTAEGPSFGRNDVSGYVDLDNFVCGLGGGASGLCAGRSTDPRGPQIIGSVKFGDPFAGDYNFVGDDRVDRAGTTLTGDVYLGNFSVRNVSSLDWNDRDSGLDLDGSPFIALEADVVNTAWQFYEDLRLLWDGGRSYNWEVGGSALFEKLDVDNSFLLGTPTSVTRQRYTQKTIYYSAHAWGAWAASEEFNISGGARWNVDSRDFAIEASRFDRVNFMGLGGFSAGETDFTEQNWSGELTLEYKPFEDATFYGKYSRGWKGPHINGLVLDTSAAATLEGGVSPLEPVEPETVNVLEGGLKTQWFDRRLQVNGAGFYYDYDEIQIFQLRNAEGGIPVPTLINAADAELYGVELEITTRPLEGWAPLSAEGLQLFASFSWLVGTYKDFQQVRVNANVAGAPRVTEEFSGKTLINSPEFSFTGYAAWDFDLDGYGFLTPRFDWSFKDQVFFAVNNQEHLGQGPLWLFNVRLGYRTPSEAIEVAAFVRNLTDEVYIADAIDLSRFRSAALYAIGDPRTYGASMTLRW